MAVTPLSAGEAANGGSPSRRGDGGSGVAFAESGHPLAGSGRSGCWWRRRPRRGGATRAATPAQRGGGDLAAAATTARCTRAAELAPRGSSDGCSATRPGGSGPSDDGNGGVRLADGGDRRRGW
uniref:Uncharacterized protein n=1 Tax=Oryza meridionalis TaxID=40149 RepID=A0A0E0CLT9_9ORYZ